MMLTDLPNEILLLVARHLPDTTDVLHFASCSRGMKDLLLPHAYTCVTITSNCISSLSRLATVLSCKPSLGSRVRCLHIGPPARPCKHKCNARYNPSGINSILSKLAYTEEEKHEWNDSLIGRGDSDWEQEDAWWAILWTLMPNIEELDVTWQYGTDCRERILERVGALSDRFNVGSTFMKLREVNLKLWCKDVVISGEDALLFFRLPALRKFLGYYILELGANRDDPDEEELQGFSTVTDIELHSSNSSTGFRQLTRACASLKSVVYHHASIRGNTRLLAPPAFYKSLSRHKRTLESISMNGDPGFGMGMGSPYFGSLFNFTALKTLSIPAMCILDWIEVGNRPLNHVFDVLPVSLERLAIEDFHHCVNKRSLGKQMEDLLKATPERYPSLHYVNIVGHFCDKTRCHSKIDPEDPPLDPKIMRIAARLALICMTKSLVHFGVYDTIYGWVDPENFCPCCLSSHIRDSDDPVGLEDVEVDFDDDDEEDESEAEDDRDDDEEEEEEEEEDDDDDDDEPTLLSGGEISPAEND
ncbi:hypothetical protein BJY01DRAFT_136758 [Aspergillus pseudoustus]|uniref:Leucine-rich repeat domain-containing protein n=1 Tax=Aspergillus pseudoustus TaxID=1810923 RepID=A0ABR4KZE5_9EURO